MSTLQTALDRLYDHSGAPHPEYTRTLVLELARPAEWDLLSPLWRGVQTDLELPAPAIAVNGMDGFQLWFSLAEAVPHTLAQTFLEGLRTRYLHTVARARIGTWSGTSAPAVPALHPVSGCWSAFVAPDLAAIFSEEPWLDLPPNPEAQANVLARLESIRPAAFHAVLQQCTGVTTAPAPAAVLGEVSPERFLREVMNNPQVDMHLRIEAAKALLPHCASCANHTPQ